MKSCLLLLLLGLLAAGLAGGCGNSDPTAGAAQGKVLTRTTGVALDGRVGPANAGVRLAEERGYFEAAGLDFWSGSPALPAKAAAYIDQKTDTFGIVSLPELVLARERGMPLVAIGSLVPDSTAAMIWLRGSQIDGVDDLKGKTVAIAGAAYQQVLLEAVLERAGLSLADVRLKRVGYGLVAALLDGRADAIFGGSGNVEGAVLEADGKQPVVESVGEMGIPAYDELVVIARRDLVESEPGLARGFMAALRRGVEAERRDPAAAVQLIEGSFESSPEASREGTEAGVEATVPLLSQTGEINPEQTERFIAWMKDEGLIQRSWSAASLIVSP